MSATSPPRASSGRDRISPIRCRGLSEAVRMLEHDLHVAPIRRVHVAGPRAAFVRRRQMLPANRAKPVSARAIEDLPEPDSPTRPRISRLANARDRPPWSPAAERHGTAWRCRNGPRSGSPKAERNRRACHEPAGARAAAPPGPARASQPARGLRKMSVAGASSTIAATLDDRHPVGDPRDQCEVVRDVERGDAGLVASAVRTDRGCVRR